MPASLSVSRLCNQVARRLLKARLAKRTLPLFGTWHHCPLGRPRSESRGQAQNPWPRSRLVCVAPRSTPAAPRSVSFVSGARRSAAPLENNGCRGRASCASRLRYFPEEGECGIEGKHLSELANAHRSRPGRATGGDEDPRREHVDRACTAFGASRKPPSAAASSARF